MDNITEPTSVSRLFTVQALASAINLSGVAATLNAAFKLLGTVSVYGFVDKVEPHISEKGFAVYIRDNDVQSLRVWVDRDRFDESGIVSGKSVVAIGVLRANPLFNGRLLGVSLEAQVIRLADGEISPEQIAYESEKELAQLRKRNEHLENIHKKFIDLAELAASIEHAPGDTGSPV